MKFTGSEYQMLGTQYYISRSITLAHEFESQVAITVAGTKLEEGDRGIERNRCRRRCCRDPLDESSLLRQRVGIGSGWQITPTLAAAPLGWAGAGGWAVAHTGPGGCQLLEPSCQGP